MEIIKGADYLFGEAAMCDCQVVDDDGGCWETDQNN